MKILAVDYGASRTGLAVCDPTEFLTTPITPQITLKARPKVAAEVCRIAQEQKAELIVVGLPLNMDGTEGERAEKSRKLGKTLQIWSGLPVRMWDERQSTCEAADILDEVGTFGAHRKAIYRLSCLWRVLCCTLWRGASISRSLNGMDIPKI